MTTPAELTVAIPVAVTPSIFSAVTTAKDTVPDAPPWPFVIFTTFPFA